jgi:dihydrofolate reductase
VKISVFIATSLDGYIARLDGGIDWLPQTPEPHGYDEFMVTVDALLIGRKTYETVLGFGGWAYGTKPVFVLSTRPLAPAPKQAIVKHLSGEPETIVAQLTSRGLKHVYLDGGLTIQRFLRAGLVDRMIITRIPVLIGSGIPLFGPTNGDIHFTHVVTRSYPSGLVQSEYLAAR